MKFLVKISRCVITLVMFFSISVQAVLIDRGDGLIYDSEQDITWLQDANLIGGFSSWVHASFWADNLIYQGFDDWRLYNADPSCGLGPSCTTNELGYLYYNYFGLTEGDGIPAITTNPNFALFANILNAPYWSGTIDAVDPSLAWSFNLSNGLQETYSLGRSGLAWAVRDGDAGGGDLVDTPTRVSAPNTLLLFGFVVASLVVRRRKLS
jgi:hypothetical protein